MPAQGGERRVVLITGAGKGSGLGFSVAQGFARAGWDLAIAGRSHSRLREAAAELEDLGASVLTVQLEMTREDAERSACAAAEAAVQRFGRIDCLVNAAQVAKVGDTLERAKPTDLATALDTGVYTAFCLMRACFEQLRRQGGSVINLASAAAAAGQPGLGLLAASKEGLRAMSLVAAAEWEPLGVRVQCVEPCVRSGAYASWEREYPDAAAEAALQLEDSAAFARRCVALASRPAQA